jgi:hypothetical protein
LGPGPYRQEESKARLLSPDALDQQGGGFFIPGLEGYRLRLASAVLVIVLLTLNRFPGYDAVQTQVISEVIGLGAAVVLLAQVSFETRTHRHDVFSE